MALMRLVAIAILIILSRTETRAVPQCRLTCCKTGIITTTFLGAFPNKTGYYGPNEAPGLIAILIIMLNTVTLPLPPCSSPCYKTGIITADEFSWCVSKSRRGLVVN